MIDVEVLVLENIKLGAGRLSEIERVLSLVYARETLVYMWSVEGDDKSLYRLLKLTADSSRRLVLFCKPGSVGLCAKYLYMVGYPSIELVALAEGETLPLGVYEELKRAYEHGVDDISIYIVYNPGLNVRRIRTIASTVLSWPYKVSLRIGPPLGAAVARGDYSQVRELFDEVSLPYGLLYGLLARRALVEGYYVTLLEPPCPRDCRRITVSSEGVYKCPFDKGRVEPFTRITVDVLEAIACSRCTFSSKSSAAVGDVHIRVLVEYKGVIIPEDVLEVLVAVKMLSSFRSACRMLGVNPAHMFVKIKRIEERIGCRLVEGYRGGRGGGYTVLTRVGEEIVRKYLEARSAVGC